MAQHARSAIRRIGDGVKTLVFSVVAQHAQHLDCEFRTFAVRATMFPRLLFVEVQTKQNRQAVVMVVAKRQPHDHAQHNPTVPPIRDRLPTTGKQRVVMHADAEHLPTTFASQGVVDSDEGGIAAPRHDQIQHGQTYRIERPAGRTEQAVI